MNEFAIFLMGITVGFMIILVQDNIRFRREQKRLEQEQFMRMIDREFKRPSK